MPSKEGIADKNMFVGHTVNSTTSVEYKQAEHKHVVGEKTRVSPKASPPPSKIPKPPPPLPVKVSPAPKSEINKECKGRIAAIKASSPDMTKAIRVEPDKRLEPSRKSKETLVLDHKDTWLEEKHEDDIWLDPRRKSKASVSEVDKRLNHLRKSKESLAGYANKQSDPLRKSREASIIETDKRSGSLRKSEELSVKAATGPKASPETRDLVAEAHKVPQKPQETSTKIGAAHKHAGPAFVGKTTLCSECKAASKKTVCFIANDGRVAACSSGSSGHTRCKYKWCAANDPDYVSPSAPQPKKYLVSKRHLLKAQIAPKSKSEKMPSPSKNQKLPSPLADQKGNLVSQFSSYGDEASSSSIEALEDDRSYSDDGNQCTPQFGSGSESPEIKSNNGTSFDMDVHCVESGGEQVKDRRSGRTSRVRRSYIDLTQEQESETVKLRRQLMQERKQAGEWMIDSAIEEALQKLAPSGETRVKVLVEAFESVISHNDGESQELHHWSGNHENISHKHIAMHC